MLLISLLVDVTNLFCLLLLDELAFSYYVDSKNIKEILS